MSRTMAQMLTARSIFEPAESGVESYEMRWTIPRWREVRKSEGNVYSQVAVFETRSSPSSWLKTKWLVGLKLVPAGNSGRKARLYWKLLEIKGTQSTKVEAKLQTQLLNSGTGSPRYTDEKIQEVKLMEVVEETSECLQFKPDSSSTDGTFMGLSGEVGFVLKLQLKTPTVSYLEYERYKMGQFWKKCLNSRLQNFEELLADHETADLKFLTSDEIEIPAHRIILKAQCPVFAAMLNCDLSENSTGIIRMTDISGKTMKILLNYFYTGDLLLTWRDPDVIVEMTYAAGKYQMTEVLELLDDMLGRNPEEDISPLDVQLVNLAGKLKLEKAEARLLKRIVVKISNVTTSGEIFKLFGFEEQELSKLAEMMANEKLGESKILESMDDLYGYDTNESEICLEYGMIMLAAVEKKGLKKLEKNLLKCFAEKAELVKNAEELFDLFGRGKQMVK